MFSEDFLVKGLGVGTDNERSGSYTCGGFVILTTIKDVPWYV